MNSAGSKGVCASGLAMSLILVLFISSPLQMMVGSGETTDLFSGGSPTATVVFGAGGGTDDSAALELPMGTNVTGASFTVSTRDAGTGEYPSEVTVDVGGDGDFEWQFNYTGFGKFGLQERLSNSLTGENVIVQDGYDDSLAIRLPKGATVTNASVNITGAWNGIRNGDFAKEWEEERKADYPVFSRLREEAFANPMNKVEDVLLPIMQKGQRAPKGD